MTKPNAFVYYICYDWTYMHKDPAFINLMLLIDILSR